MFLPNPPLAHGALNAKPFSPIFTPKAAYCWLVWDGRVSEVVLDLTGKAGF